MAVALVNTWHAGNNLVASVTIPPPSVQSLAVSVANNSGNWLIAAVSWVPLTAQSTATVAVSDDLHNWWEPASSPNSTSNVTGNIRTSIWVAPQAFAANTVMASPTGQISSIAMTVHEFSGMGVWLNSAAVNTFSNSTSSLGPLNLGAMTGSALVIAAGTMLNDTGSIQFTGAGFSAALVNADSGVTQLGTAWQQTSSATAITWSPSLGGPYAFASVTAEFLVAGTALTTRNPNWPVTIAEAAFGSGFQTPDDARVYVPVTTSYLKLGITQGRQYETAQLASGEGTLYLDNPYGQLTPTIPQQWQASYTSGSSANPLMFAPNIPVIASVTYTWSAYVETSAYWAGGTNLQLDWRDGGNAHISNSGSVQVFEAGVTTLLTVTGQAPSNAASVVPGVISLGTPGAGAITVQVANGPNSNLQIPATTTWTGSNGATAQTLLPFVPYTEINTGTPVRLRCNWQGGTYQVNFHGDGVHGNPGVTANTLTTGGPFATPGVTYGFTASVGMSQNWASGVTLIMNFANGSFVNVGTFTSTQTATTAQPTFLSVSGIAPATTAFISLDIQAAGTPASTIIFSAAAAPVAPATNQISTPVSSPWTAYDNATITSQTAWAQQVAGPPVPSSWFIPFSGYIERLPQEWDPQLRGFTEATITDYWFSANMQPQPFLLQEILNDEPYAYWPCTDATNAAGASNIAPGNSNQLLITPSVYGSTGSTSSFGQNSGALLGATSAQILTPQFTTVQNTGMWGLTNTTVNSDLFHGISLSVTDSNLPKIGQGVTFEMWWQIIAPFATGGTAQTCVALLASTAHPVLEFYIDTVTGHLKMIDFTDSSTYTLSTVNYRTGTPPLIQLAGVFNRNTYNIYLNGASVLTGSFSASLRQTWSFISCNGMFNNQATWAAWGVPTSGQANFNGYVGHVAVFPYQLTADRIYTHYRAGLFAMQAENTSFRIERLLQAGNALGKRTILQDPNVSGVATRVVSGQDIPSQPVSGSVMNVTSDVLPGIFFIAPTGDMFYRERGTAYNQQIAYAIGDAPYNGETTYSGDISYDYDPTRIFNLIQLTNLDDNSVLTPSVTSVETASQNQFGVISELVTCYLQVDSNYALNLGPSTQDFANWLACTYNDPQIRLARLTVTAQDNPANWNLVLDISVGDVVTVARRPLGPTVEPFLFQTVRVSQTERQFEFSEETAVASVTLVIDACPEEYAITLNDPVRGLLNGTNVLAW